jgi:outer membrane protein assembly factor BamB
MKKRDLTFSQSTVLVAALLCFLDLSRPLRLLAQDVLTWHNDNARTGQNLEETTLTLQNVNPRTFGKLFVLRVDGKVDAEPLYVARTEIPHKGFRNVLFVATEHDSLYAFDADTGEQFWHVRLLKLVACPLWANSTGNRHHRHPGHRSPSSPARHDLCGVVGYRSARPFHSQTACV